MPNAEVLTINAADKTFTTRSGESIHAIDNVSIEIQPGEFFILLGPSGCGKTTLLRALAGLEELDSGEIYLGDQRLDVLPPHRRPVNTVFQSYALFPHLSVEENVAFGLQMDKLSKRETADRVHEMLDLVHLSQKASSRPSELSGGQQQRIALARALAKSPKVLLLDESLSALDFKLRREMQDELKSIQRHTGITFIFVTHDQEEALSMGDRIAVFSQGKPSQIGTAQDIYDAPKTRFVADFIGDINFFEGTLAQDGVVESNNARLKLSEDAASVGVGSAVTVAVRPENMRLEEPREGLLQGTLTSKVYMGTDIRCHVRLASGGHVLLRVPPALQYGRFTEGSQVSIAVDPKHTRIVEG
ncbi:ABC transporter ATP-binding protein [Bifidobacterium psychraerophilum]|uniref:Spermidine/putrescine import ATP-binding protein PotA n=2 Tax=Bifidobacterium psychraerophilum TaxID=218140 RepID=A0A087CHM7_9BIFI|nr:ABC transporter ATP-binding protein [Bifidobacterium psychraerophilum]KFI82777.1 spermidine/putrescine, ABC transporter, ATP-binding protein PotA [Bifidobacterium psychraerophilum]PKA94527.1 spermidine/putrescine transport system ATP-binding protein [Bifidobacterium psychraerophilum DSM 22366]